MSGPLSVHVKSGNDDLGEHTLAVFENTNWQFCENFWMTTMFWADFNSNGTRTASFHVWDHQLGLTYGSGSYINIDRRLVWLVRDDGFYVGKRISPFPDGWEKLHDWLKADVTGGWVLLIPSPLIYPKKFSKLDLLFLQEHKLTTRLIC
ncbi:plant self-incompatibility S1 [Artemisia annua]|uniref:S-protein homolog n=1 Tax=Artemisia annua TaxID=35608 RepID=A0A2U1N5F4_ARTAN|nr:plant self-incompatibility S1 [Artemisia annua]